MIITQLVLPLFALAIVTVLVTRAVEAVMPESVGGIAATAVLSALLCWALAAAGFAGLYALEDPRVLTLLGQTPQAGLRHFVWLGAQAALVWAPILLLVVTTAPRRWKTATW